MKSKKVQQAFQALERFTNFEKTTTGDTREYRLDRMEQMLGHFNDPHLGPKVFHIAGSKGKGSTSFFLASLLQHSGYKVGLYQSPHLIHYTERITQSGKPFSDSCYLETLEKVETYVAQKPILPGGPPTTFELLTLTAFLIFQKEKCQVLVIETGMGGRLDATNVVQPEVSIITPIEKEHTQYLGNTIQEIAAEKGGIIKPGKPVIISHQTQEALSILKEMAAQKESKCLYLPDYLRQETGINTPQGFSGTFELMGKNYHLKMNSLGNIQLKNAALSLLALSQSGIPFRETELNGITLPGRMEILKGFNTPVVIDGSHTRNSLQLAVHSFVEAFGESGILIFGLSAGKNPEELASCLVHGFSQIIVTTAGTFRPGSPREVYEVLEHHHPCVSMQENTHKAIKTAMKTARINNAPILITGSFHLAGSALEELQKLV